MNTTNHGLIQLIITSSIVNQLAFINLLLPNQLGC